MSTKKIMNDSARALNLKAISKKVGRFNIQLSPGLNFVDADTHRVLKALPYCKQLVEDEVLDFNPRKKKNTPEAEPETRPLADPSQPLGTTATDDDADDDADDDDDEDSLDGLDDDE